MVYLDLSHKEKLNWLEIRRQKKDMKNIVSLIKNVFSAKAKTINTELETNWSFLLLN